MTIVSDVSIHKLFGRDYQLDNLRQYLLRGKSCQIVGPRGIGKTALLNVMRELAPMWDSKLFVAYLDVSDPRCHTEEGFWQMAWQAWGEGVAPVSPADRSEAVAQWRKQGRRPVLCLDGFEQLTSRPKEFTTDFFLDMRSLAEAGLCMVTASNKPLSELVPFYSPTSPFFNVFAIVGLGPLAAEDAEDFLTTISAETMPLTMEEKNAILNFAQEHRTAYPLALQTATSYVIASKRNGNDLSAAMRKATKELQTSLSAS